MPEINVAFVCLGNICRSPMAEAVFADTVKKSGLQDVIGTDSFGTSAFHIGETPDRRSAATCKKHGVPVNHHAQQIFPHHFSKFDYILAMDRRRRFNCSETTRAPLASTESLMILIMVVMLVLRLTFSRSQHSARTCWTQFRRMIFRCIWIKQNVNNV